MKNTPSNRREFLHNAALAAGAVGLCGSLAQAAAPENSLMKIESPFHGAVLNHRHGKAVEGGLSVTVTGKAPAGARVTVGGQLARREGEAFSAEVVLKQFETDITAVGEGAAGRREDTVRVVWDKHSCKRYRVSIDDNSFFLRDVAQKQYRSLFDCFYLAMLRDLHRKYGTKYTINIYYTTGDDFNLSQFPDKYKGEWRDCADWLKLTFHAQADKPDRPYYDAPPEKLLADLDQVVEQIRRFAGEASYAPPTIIHWGQTRQEALKPLYERGVRALSGYFRKMGGHYDVNYRFDDIISEYLSRHDAWKDFRSGIVFSRVDIVINSTPVDKIVGTLEPLTKDPNQAEIMDLLTHEQYFWPFYKNYLPDHPQRMDAALRWVTEQGYRPVLMHEGFLGGPAFS